MKLQKFYDQAYIWLTSRGPYLVIGVLFFIIGIWLISWLRTRIQARLGKNAVHSSLRPFFLSLSVTGLYILLTLTVLNIVGIRLTFFTTIIGAFTVAVGFALSGTLQNFAGGVLILLLKPFEVDDSIIAQGQDGKVTTIQMFYTVLLTSDNKTVIIPNGKLFNEVIVNVTREGKRRLDFELKLGYVVDVEQVKQVIMDAIKVTPNILNEPATRVGIIGLDLDGIRFAVNVWVAPANFLVAKIALQEKIVNELRLAGVKLPGT
ncbi:mechanosensitive ion channel family protein [Mucilaginibacter segetis]|uniref:Mechanosensitive ion channel family protein n=1 Tax=Mucilaginibacter segetis TaxID=2793071 RepID=A0A934PNR1_9SPHI|nr:mechanosensitive ion channel family protein [Mucilaginibacter segetis]MBK0377943.1 mechanosensitive ion channel family protein [Mucilaginibacter segetis]